MSETQDKLKALRAAMKEEGVDAFIVPRADEYQNEFPPPRTERLKWLTGFTGSGGVAVVMADKAGVLTDGRYLIQIRQQVDESLFKIGNIVETKLSDWIKEHTQPGAVIGYDPWIHTVKEIEALAEKELNTRPVSQNLIDRIWDGQPDWPRGEVTLFPDDIAGRTPLEKRAQLAAGLKEKGADAVIISQPDSICWLLNIRGGDVDYAPLALCYAILYADGGVDCFIDPAKVKPVVTEHLGSDVRIYAPEKLGDIVEKFGNLSVCFDPKRSAAGVKTLLEEAGAELLECEDPCVLPKACKTKAEQQGIRQAHVRDGVALVKFLHWLDENAEAGQLSELDAVQRLRDFRAEDPAFLGDSFGTIAGFGPNGAIVHYRADEKSNLPLASGNLLLVDSGGQYPDGTTDVTRTMAVGEPVDAMRHHFTLVLKGHIALATARFSAETIGKEIDALARQFLKEEGLDFAHGTGHGVGCYLQVHEDATSISPRGEDTFKPGMLISNEPGYYEEGAYGIRIENLVLVQDAGDGMMGFETVTLAPIDTRLVDTGMLSAEELEWLNDYHALVHSTLSPFLSGDVSEWLERATKPLN